MANPRKGKGPAPPRPHEEPLLTEAQIRARYFDFLKMLARETARRDHEAAQDIADTPTD